MPDVEPRILAVAARVPLFELSADTVAKAYGRAPGRGARRFAAYDEDALTLAVEAASLCLRGRDPSALRALYVASTTWPRRAAAGAERLAAALDLPETVETAAFGGSWGCGVAALRLAAACPRWPALVVGADRLGAPAGSERETEFGDAAAAVLVGPGEGVAEILGWTSRSVPVEWESDDARWLAVQAGRLADAARRDGCARAGVSAPGARAARAAAAALGVPCSDAAMERVGFCGAAHPLLALVELLESSRPGDRVHWLTCAEGSESVVLKVCSSPAARTFGTALEHRRPVTEYGRWLTSRTFFEDGALHAVFASPALEARDADFLLRLRGARCRSCGAVSVLPGPACAGCGAGDLERRPLARTGTIFTFTHEHYVPTPWPPVTMAVVDLDGGGRILVQVADAVQEDVRVGARVRLVPRRLHMGGGVPNYYWKAVLE